MSDLKLKPRKAFLQDELNIERLTPIQWYGIIRAMQKYAEHYHEVQQQANGAETSAEPALYKHIVSNNEVMVCDCKKEWSEWEWKHNKCRKCGGIIEY